MSQPEHKDLFLICRKCLKNTRQVISDKPEPPTVAPCWFCEPNGKVEVLNDMISEQADLIFKRNAKQIANNLIENSFGFIPPHCPKSLSEQCPTFRNEHEFPMKPPPSVADVLESLLLECPNFDPTTFDKIALEKYLNEPIEWKEPFESESAKIQRIIDEVVGAAKVWAEWFNAVLELVRKRTPFDVSTWSPRTVWLSEYKEALQIVLSKQAEPKTYIFMGGAENINFFKMSSKARARLDYYWTCRKGAEIGDEAFVYLTAPLSRIVGRVVVADAPFVNYPNMFDNPYMENKFCALIHWVESFDESLDLMTAANLKKLFGKDWGWTRYPRGSTRVPDEILPPFTELVGRVRHLTRIAGIITGK